MEKFFGYLELAISCKSQDFEIVMSDFDANVVDPNIKLKLQVLLVWGTRNDPRLGRRKFACNCEYSWTTKTNFDFQNPIKKTKKHEVRLTINQETI